jgi:ribosome-associated translation inhibitor RaiA
LQCEKVAPGEDAETTGKLEQLRPISTSEAGAGVALLSCMDLPIAVVADDSISPQARTYAEYRVFAALSRMPLPLFEAQVVLRSTSASAPKPGVTCTVTVVVQSGDALRVRARGAHAYAAINRAVDRMRTVWTTPDRSRLHA